MRIPSQAVNAILSPRNDTANRAVVTGISEPSNNVFFVPSLTRVKKYKVSPKQIPIRPLKANAVMLSELI